MMRYALPAALAALTLAAPALATGGMRCLPASGTGPALDIAIGHGIVSTVISARLQHGGTVLSTGGFVETGRRRPMIVGQSWIDRREVRIDLLDEQAMRFEGQLRARMLPRRQGLLIATGTFTRNGRSWQVRCEEA